MPMKLSALEIDFLEDLAQDTHELWELYTFVRLHKPSLSEKEVIDFGRDILRSWIERGWLKAFPSRANEKSLTEEEFLDEVERLGMQATDPTKGVILLDLTDQAAKDLDRPIKRLSAKQNK